MNVETTIGALDRSMPSIGGRNALILETTVLHEFGDSCADLLTVAVAGISDVVNVPAAVDASKAGDFKTNDH